MLDAVNQLYFDEAKRGLRLAGEALTVIENVDVLDGSLVTTLDRAASSLADTKSKLFEITSAHDDVDMVQQASALLHEVERLSRTIAAIRRKPVLVTESIC